MVGIFVHVLKVGKHQGRDVLCAQLSLDVGVIQLADEGVGPGLAGVHGDVHVVLAVPLPALLLAAWPDDPPLNGCMSTRAQRLV